MQTSWLTYKITTKVSETEFQESLVKWNDYTDPFQIATYPWDELRSEMDVRDELWLFSSSKESWKNLAGRAGVCIVRDGEIVKSKLSVVS